jgi:RimK family alpha-L-glutamate ligase
MVISKPLFGSQGEGIRRLEKMTDLLWLTGSQGVYYLQRFVECDGLGYSDHRVFVINGKAVAAMRRKGLSWLNNVARGAVCEEIVLDPVMAELAVQAAQALSMSYAGVDIIRDKEGRYQVIEANSIPAWKGLQSVCNISIADLLVEDLLRQLGSSGKSRLMAMA